MAGHQEECSGPHIPVTCFHYFMSEYALRCRYDTSGYIRSLVKEDSETFAIGQVRQLNFSQAIKNVIWKINAVVPSYPWGIRFKALGG